MKRRHFIALVGGAAAAWPLAARAQQSNEIKRIGIVMPYAEHDPEASPRLSALREGLLKLGWTEGRATFRIAGSIDRWAAADLGSLDARVVAAAVHGVDPAIVSSHLQEMRSLSSRWPGRK